MAAFGTSTASSTCWVMMLSVAVIVGRSCDAAGRPC